jgi:hypothetical protein
MVPAEGSIDGHAVVSHEAWLAARSEFLAKEKEDGLPGNQDWVRFHDRYGD